jgi:ATP-binding cassette subfamily B protein
VRGAWCAVKQRASSCAGRLTGAFVRTAHRAPRTTHRSAATLGFAYRALIAPWPPFIVFLIAIGVIGGLTPLLQIKATTGLIDALASRAEGSRPAPDSLIDLLRPYLPWLLLMIGMMMVDKTAVNGRTFQPYMAARLNERVKERADRLLLQKALSLRLALFESPLYYDCLQRARQVLGENLGDELTQIQRLVAYIPANVVILWQLGQAQAALPVVLLCGTLATLSWRYRVRRAFLELDARQTPLRRKLEYLQSLLIERSPAAEVRLFHLRDHLLDAWRGLNAGLLRQLSDARLSSLRRELPRTLFPIGIYGLVILTLLRAAAHGAVSPGAFVALLFAAQQYQDQLRPTTIRVEAVVKLLHELAYLQEFLSLKGEEARTGAAAPPVLRDGILFHGVSFSYSGGRSPALAGIDLRIRPGERIALVGENGAGKSTLVKLLLGLYLPTEGQIAVDGMDLRSIAPASWRGKVAAVFQDHVRYNLTARENIGFGQIEKLGDRHAIETAARSSTAAEMIRTLPAGYETMLGKEFEGGQDLSRGQWQKLAIARAYLRDAELLVLDEPAAALDALAEQEVYRQFLQLAVGKTVLLISHRLGSARLADRILFLQHGRIIQEGTHDDLIAAGGPYAELYALQAEWYR